MTDDSSRVKEVLEDMVTQIVEALVLSPNQAEVNVTVGGIGVVVEIKPVPSDAGFLIGKSGQTIKAIRLLVCAAAKKFNKTAMFNVVSPDTRRKNR